MSKVRKRDRYYVYIFVNQDYEPIYQSVQMAHVAMVMGQNLSPEFDARNLYFCVCKIPERIEYKNGEVQKINSIEEFAGVLLFEGFKVEYFYEPDVEDVVAIGVYPVRSDKRGILKDFELLKF